MPIFMDVHLLPGVKAGDVAVAHRMDVELESQYNCKCMTYWIDEERENVFCLIEAPDKESVLRLHQQAHGLLPHRIIEVDPELVQSFLGRIHDPESVEVNDGSNDFHEPSFRFILIQKFTDPRLLNHAVGTTEAERILCNLHSLCGLNHVPVASFPNIRAASFRSFTEAIYFKNKIEIFAKQENIQLSSFLTAGEPIGNTGPYFDDCLKLSGFLLCSAGMDDLVSYSAAQHAPTNASRTLTQREQEFISSVCTMLEQNYFKPDFQANDFCKIAGMSRSAFYRAAVNLFGNSPNNILHYFRLNKSLKPLKEKQRVSEVAYSYGFNSPSYFSKCFRKHFGLLPADYSQLRETI